MFRLMFRLALAGIALGAATAHAVPCGTVLHASHTLTADMICPSGVDGLVIGADKVRIDLNGFRIRGPFTGKRPSLPAVGIRSSGFWNVQVVGPGRISGFTTVVDIEGGGNHLVDNVIATAEYGLPFILRNVVGSTVQNSRLTGLVLASDAGFKAVGNHIVGNDIGPLPGLNGGGVALQGCGTADNVVASNTIHPEYAHAVSIYDGARANQVLDNRMERGQVYLHGAVNNVIAGNRWVNDAVTAAAVEIVSSYAPVACAGGVILGGAKNIVRDNAADSGQFGVYIDDLSGNALSSGNLVTGNTFSNQTQSGLFLGQGAVGNDGRANTYVNVPTMVYDYGTGNLWP